ncbi:MAG: pimeloyl-ACP methyl ester carboxylesterase [Flavobacteriales bacterium]|jgi:pimeloyl-ACP methyl ester carboxylesterase
MGNPNKQTIEYLKGLTKLVIHATKSTTDLVEAMHSTIERGHLPLGESRATSTSGITGLVYKSIRGGAQLVGTSLDYAMQKAIPLLDDEHIPSRNKDIFLSVINGVYGDRLSLTNNELALRMTFIHQQQAVDTQLVSQIKSPSDKILLFIHGLCMSHHSWESDKQNLSKNMAEKLGFTPIYLHYNTGRAIADNGHELAEKIEQLVASWPVNVSNITIVGHSMGGLVARSARYYSEQDSFRWIQLNKKLISIGTPHSGAPLEKFAAMLESLMQRSPYAVPFVRLTKIRSKGIENLRHGEITAIADKFVPLPIGIEYFAIAAILSKKENFSAETIVGDGLVTPSSAFGQHKDPARTLAIPDANKSLKYELGHNEMLWDIGVYQQLEKWL